MVIFAVVCVVIGMLIFGLAKCLNSGSAEYVLKILKKNRGNAALVFRENSKVRISIRPDYRLPLASTVKLIVAMEYAFQSKEGKIKVNEKISLTDLEKFYMPNLDGGAHQAWLNYIREQALITEEAITLREVARGMIAFSSNANTEYLMSKLGIEQIERRLKETGLSDHSGLYYFSSSIFIPYEIWQHDYQHLPIKEAKFYILEEMNSLTEEEWIEKSEVIHDKLLKNERYKDEVNVRSWYSREYDELFSKRFIRSTANTYTKLMRKVNDRQFPEGVQEELEYLLGMIMESPANQSWLARAGKKGGSTQYILTDALFAEDRQGNKYELVIFFYPLKLYEIMKLNHGLNDFEKKLLQDEEFRLKAEKELAC